MPRLDLDIPLSDFHARGHSLLQHARLLHGEHVINFDVVHVTTEPFDDDQLRTLDDAIAVTRGVYTQVGLGVGRVAHVVMASQDAERYTVVGSHDEGKSLFRRFRGPHDDALDVFVVPVLDLGLVSGLAKTGIPCDKDSEVLDGCLVSFVYGGAPTTALGSTIAHEVGHCLGLGHERTNVLNLMFPALAGDALSQLTQDQGLTMRSHCFVRPGC